MVYQSSNNPFVIKLPESVAGFACLEVDLHGAMGVLKHWSLADAECGIEVNENYIICPFKQSESAAWNTGKAYCTVKYRKDDTVPVVILKNMPVVIGKLQDKTILGTDNLITESDIEFTADLSECAGVMDAESIRQAIVIKAYSVASVNGKTGAVVLDYSDVGAASAAQGALAETALQAVPDTYRTAAAQDVIDRAIKTDITPIINSEKTATSGYVWTATADGAGWAESQGGDTEYMVITTYAELKALRGSGSLVAGMQYRITNYQCGTIQANTRAMSNQYDIIVTADDSKTLNHKARAILHDGDTYFANCNLNEWQLWYDLDNSAKYPWIKVLEHYEDLDACKYYLTGSSTTGTDGRIYLEADCDRETYYIVHESDSYVACEEVDGYDDGWTVSFVEAAEANATGTVYRMIDDCGNDVPYDFKNIQFKRYKVDDWYQVDEPDEYSEDDVKWCYTFDDENGNDTSLASSNCVNDNVFKFDNTFYYGLLNDVFFGQGCCCNTFGQGCYNNTFEQDCYNNTFEQECYNNTFGQGCCCNTFEQECYNNTFEQDCYYNTFGQGCYYNTFGQDCYYNTFGQGCCNNTFEQGCYYNTFGQDCYNNTFGQGCCNNTFEQGCCYNTFGQGCYYNTFEQDCYCISFGLNCYSNTFEKYNRYIKLDGSSTICNGRFLKLLAGICGTSMSNPLVIYNASDTYHFNSNTEYAASGITEATVENVTGNMSIRYIYVRSLSAGKATYYIYYKTTLDGTAWSFTSATL